MNIDRGNNYASLLFTPGQSNFFRKKYRYYLIIIQDVFLSVLSFHHRQQTAIIQRLNIIWVILNQIQNMLLDIIID
jgi:hypothetical protein